MAFVALETGLKIDDFSKGILGASQIQSIRQVEGKCVGSRALSNTIPGSLKPDHRDPGTGTGNLETERVHRIHGTLETGL